MKEKTVVHSGHCLMGFVGYALLVGLFWAFQYAATHLHIHGESVLLCNILFVLTAVAVLLLRMVALMKTIMLLSPLGPEHPVIRIPILALLLFLPPVTEFIAIFKLHRTRQEIPAFWSC